MIGSVRFLAVAALTLSSGLAMAQSYPSKPITFIVPFAAGGTSDVIARLAADEMGRALDQRLVIENVGGAGGSIGLTRASRAAPDGYTLTIGNAGTNAAVYWTTENVPFKPESFAPVGLVAKTSPVIALRKNFPAATVAETIAYAKQNPGKMTLGHAGVGSSNYLICMSFVKAAAIDVSLVSYRGAAPALNDAMGGHVDGVCDAATSVAAAINAGEVKGLVVSAHQRLKNLPEVPAAQEAGVPAFQAEGWNALFLPAGAPEPVIAKLNEALRKAVASDTVQSRLAELSALPASGEELTADYVRQLVPKEVEKYRVLLGK
ncbi:tripartite tricarboxylate transporter substrate-binding protein [Methylocella sp. CPCC 101449]|uniref:tripartite tricarboxylate transporter substrate-binding protein n=1 Tax=Methylocella sp. CPCC 101449 TaxID=2987531 RepID=UPI002892821B|nr:tripartite tricarboxylate transporter substrate-binding protein [Methylocella sp. CPCC 101449]MDT2023473.1 tripartite tricarboxylate transporter substrate-binding protein [Methylocella sp. CPCC 101449]